MARQRILRQKDESDTYDQLQSFLGTLRQGGQILTKVYPILQKSDALEAIVMTLEKDALKEENDSIYTLKLRQSFGAALSIKLLEQNAFESNLCTCESPTAHVLYTTPNIHTRAQRDSTLLLTPRSQG